MKKEETETNKEQASMTEDYYVENASCDEEENTGDMVVIGEGEDHAYCQMGPYSYCCADYGQHPTIRCEATPKSELHLNASADRAEEINSSTNKSSGHEANACTSNNGEEKDLKPPLVYVRHDRTWKFQKATIVATCDEDGQFFYHPDPFSPAPPFKGAPSAVKRMEFAAKRIDNRKYKDQRTKVLESDNMDSATCSKCKMRFFLPFSYFKSRITYRVPENPYLLPMPRFRCPLCEEDSPIEL